MSVDGCEGLNMLSRALIDMDKEAETEAIEKWLRMADKPLGTKRTQSQEKKRAIVKING